MAERALQIAPYPGQVAQILRLAVAQIEAREDPENLAGALGGERDVGLDERRAVEIRLAAAASAHVAAEQRELGFFGYVHARILQQRGKIVGGRSHHGVLEIEQAEPGEFAALRQPDEIGGMEVA